MPNRENFGLQGCARPEQPGHGAPDQLEEIAHRRDYRPILRRSLFWVYGRSTVAVSQHRSWDYQVTRRAVPGNLTNCREGRKIT
jgi:hypothetical protein